MIKVILGVICAMLSLWLGGYVLWESQGYWYAFPSFVTSVLGFFGGAFYAYVCCMMALHDKSKEAGKA